MSKSPKLLSIIIPVFNQEKTILKNLQSVYATSQNLRYASELIIVVDGQVDRSYTLSQQFAKNKPNVRAFQLKPQQGKGYAVRYGMKQAHGHYIAFIDAGMEIDPNGLSMLLEHLEWYNADVIVGSKRHLASKVSYPWDRTILSWGYYWLVRTLFGVKIKDTQAGIKIFKRQVLTKVLPKLLVKHYAFDIELLSVANRLGFTRIYEAPIKLDYQFDQLTKASTLKTIYRMLWDTAAVFYRLKLLRYYD